MDRVEEVILDDIFKNGRDFLPGPRPDRADIMANLQSSILYDGLSLEESALFLSVLPGQATRLFVAPMDKGLSGAKVVMARYSVGQHRLSKPFVIKVGPKDKILREATAMRELVAPFIPGAVAPIIRVGKASALLVQELAGLGASAVLQSLRMYVRASDHADRIILRLFDGRFRNWYQLSRDQEPVRQGFSDLFEWYLDKARVDRAPAFPDRWSSLKSWVEDQTGHGWCDPELLLPELLSRGIVSPLSIIHGDLHSQNVVVDTLTEECWPIDFAWCHDGSSLVVDYVMLECSLKFLALPARCDLRSLMLIDRQLILQSCPEISIDRIPYSDEVQNVLRAITAVRRHAMGETGLDFSEYLEALWLMTYSHAKNEGLNRPAVLASLQMLSSTIDHGN